MRVLLVPQVYPPETHPTAVMVRELALALVARGYAVTVACGYPHHPHGEVFGGYVKRPLLRESSDGIEVLRVWHVTSIRRSITIRAAVMLSQSLATTIAAQMMSEPPDVILNVGPPLVGPLAGGLLARRFGAKLLTVIFDIYPDVAESTGKIRNRALVVAARVAEQLAYRVSDRIVVLSEGFRRKLMDKGVPAGKLAVVPVWLQADEIQPMPRETGLRAELGLGASKFVVLYAGTIGVVSGAAVVPAAAALVRDPRIVFLFVGEGEALADVRDRVVGLKLDNVLFLPRQPRERLQEVQASADVGLVTLGPGLGRTSVPSKVVGYLAAGRPVIASVDPDSDTAYCVLESGGVVVPPGDPAALARAVEEMACRNLGAARRAARAAFLREYTAEAAIGRYVQLFDDISGTPPRGAA